MDELIAEVARVTSWKAGPPVGPLGQHVRLKPAHEHHRLAVEPRRARRHLAVAHHRRAQRRGVHVAHHRQRLLEEGLQSWGR